MSFVTFTVLTLKTCIFVILKSGLNFVFETMNFSVSLFIQWDRQVVCLIKVLRFFLQHKFEVKQGLLFWMCIQKAQSQPCKCCTDAWHPHPTRLWSTTRWLALMSSCVFGWHFVRGLLMSECLTTVCAQGKPSPQCWNARVLSHCCSRSPPGTGNSAGWWVASARQRKRGWSTKGTEQTPKILASSQCLVTWNGPFQSCDC